MCKVILLAVLTLVATAARGENSLFYLGAGAVRSSVTDITDQFAYPLPDLKNTSWKAYAGVRPLNRLAVEVDYIDLGSASSAGAFGVPTYTAHISASAFATYVVGLLPIPFPAVDIFGKAGLSWWSYDQHFYIPADVRPNSQQGRGFAWGVGVQAHISIVGARLEYENLKIPNSSGAKVASLSVFLNF